MYIKRYLETTIEKLSGCCKVLLVTGPRQVGKTTLLRRLAESNRTYVTMDDINVRSLAMTEPGLFLQRYKPPLLIDEIQMAPKLLPYIKMYVDEHGNNGDFWLTGSHAFDLMENVTESLAGRIAIVHLLGFSHAEVEPVLVRELLCRKKNFYCSGRRKLRYCRCVICLSRSGAAVCRR